MGNTTSERAKVYRIKDKPKYLLGQGGFGRVIRVTRKEDKMVFAMKISLRPLDTLEAKDLLY